MTSVLSSILRCLLPVAVAYRLFAVAVVPSTAPDRGDPVWKDEHGHAAPNTEFRQAKRGFGGWLIVTPDADWEKKWNTSPETVPHFNTADTVERGKNLTILIFVINPARDARNNVDVTCDMQSIRPDGSLSIDQKNVPCLKGELQGDPYNIRLAAPVIRYVGEEKDLAGKWIIRVTLKDNRRHVELPLQTSFTLK
jgi:hypothetical protein